MLHALIDIADLLLASSPGSSSSRSILSWLFAFNVLNTSSQGVRSLRGRDRSDHRAALPADPADPARFRRDRFLAAGDPDPDPGHQEAARRRRHPILLRRMTAKRIDGKAAAQAIRERVAARSRIRSQAPAGRRASRPCWSARIRRAPSMSARRTARPPRPGWRASRTICPTRRSEDELLAAGRSTSTPIRAVDGILVQLPLPEADRRAAR